MRTNRINFLQWIFVPLMLILVSTFTTSCEYDFIETPTPPPVDSTGEATVKFSTDIIPFFNASCNSSSCHAKGAVPPDLSPDGAYAALRNGGWINNEKPAESNLYKSITTGSMRMYSNATNNQKVLVWISEGARNN